MNGWLPEGGKQPTRKSNREIQRPASGGLFVWVGSSVDQGLCDMLRPKQEGWRYAQRII
jgi:hypothetical protein